MSRTLECAAVRRSQNPRRAAFQRALTAYYSPAYYLLSLANIVWTSRLRREPTAKAQKAFYSLSAEKLQDMKYEWRRGLVFMP